MDGSRAGSPIGIDRRMFLRATGSAFAALAASGCMARGHVADLSLGNGYGPLVADPAGLLDLPTGFSYRVVSKLGDPMSDGGTVPERARGCSTRLSTVTPLASTTTRWS